MTVLIALVLFGGVFMQQLVPAPAPAPPPSPPRASTSAQLTVAEMPSPEDYGSYLYSVFGVTVVKTASGGTALVSDIWSLPDFLTSSRKPENTVDQPDAAALNDQIVKMAVGFVLIAMLLVLGYNFVSLLRGQVPNPMVAAGLLSMVALAALAAVNNRWLQHFPIDMVNVVLSTISGAPIKQFVNPVFHVSTMGDQLWAGFMLLALVIVTLGLTVILFIEGAWCIVLGALMGLAAMGMPLPIFGGASRFLFSRWMGSLFSPVIVFAALRLAAPSTGALLLAGAPDLGVQLLTLAFLMVAWQSPGLMVGAIAVSLPSVSSVYFAGRLVGAGRFSERMISHGGGGGNQGGPGGGASRSAPPRSRQSPPMRVSSFGMGSGSGAGGKWIPRLGTGGATP